MAFTPAIAPRKNETFRLFLGALLIFFGLFVAAVGLTSPREAIDAYLSLVRRKVKPITVNSRINAFLDYFSFCAELVELLLINEKIFSPVFLSGSFRPCCVKRQRFKIKRAISQQSLVYMVLAARAFSHKHEYFAHAVPFQRVTL